MENKKNNLVELKKLQEKLDLQQKELLQKIKNEEEKEFSKIVKNMFGNVPISKILQFSKTEEGEKKLIELKNSIQNYTEGL